MTEIEIEPANAVDHILVQRLCEYVDYEDPWGCGFHPKLVRHGTDRLRRCYTDDDMRRRTRWTPEMHAARIRFIMESQKDLASPIEMDCVCDHGHVYAQPLILDGWHRFFAHRALRSKRIPVSFSGRVDLLKYLRGDTNKKPEE